MDDNEFKKKLERLNAASSDTHKIQTPLGLCRDMIDSLLRNSPPKKGKSYLCITNFEFLYVLKEKLGSLDDVWYATPDLDVKGAAACAMGVKSEHVLIFKNGTADIQTTMKFDGIISNPPYNPNSIWKKFVEWQISRLKDDGKMVTIHPSAWKDSSDHKKFFDKIKLGIEELHIGDYENFNEVRVKTDWYLYNKSGSTISKIYYPNKDYEELILSNVDRLYRIATTSIPYNIIKKIFTKKDNGLIAEKGFNPLYKEEFYFPDGKYKQCGGKGRNRGNGWTEGNFVYTNITTKHQFESKVVTAYTHKPRAQYFSKDEQVGVILGNYWLTDNQYLPLLLNSKMFWRLYLSIISSEPGSYGSHEIPANVPAWIYRTINFDGLKAATEEELYKHYKLSEEEINWINE